MGGIIVDMIMTFEFRQGHKNVLRWVAASYIFVAFLNQICGNNPNRYTPFLNPLNSPQNPLKALLRLSSIKFRGDTFGY